MSSGINHDAIVFFDGNIIAKEMLYPEFEAILDHVVAIHEFKATTAKAAFIRINSCLKITAAVFFTIDFDAQGFVDKSWNIPLSHLAENAGKGADLGAGRIKLSCRSQCSVSWHQRSLWDPVLEEGDTNTLNILAQAITRNRLGLTQEVEPVISEEAAPKIHSENASARVESEEKLREELKKEFKTELKAQSKAIAEEHKLRLAALKSEAQDHLEKIQHHYRSEREKLIGKNESIKLLFAEEKHKNLQLKKTLDEQANSVKDIRQKFTEQLEENKAIGQDQLLALEEKFEIEAQAKIDAVTAELKERLDMREVELFYRDEKIKRLNEEAAQLKGEKQALVDSRGDRLLQKLVESGITFVTYQPGVEHLTIPLNDVGRYLDSPIEYVAEKCSVDKELYDAWLSHFELPVCSHSVGGSICGKPLQKIDKPSKFISGESDRCSKHNRAANTFTQLRNVTQ